MKQITTNKQTNMTTNKRKQFVVKSIKISYVNGVCNYNVIPGDFFF